MLNKSYKTAQLQMIKRKIGYAFSTTNTAITSSIVALLAVFNLLKGKVANIDALLQQYAEVLKGIAQQKKQARLTLAEITFTILKGAKAWAIANNNLELAAQFTTSFSNLNRMKFETLSEKVGNWITVITPLGGSLTDYNITAAMLTDWQTAADDFNALLNAPQSAIKDHKTLGKTITTSINDAMTLTREQIDGIVATLMQQEPDYYNGYRTQREIIDPETRHTGLLATIVNELGQPYYNLTVTVDAFTHFDEQTGKTRIYKPVSSSTDINGQALANKFHAAARMVTISGLGVETKTFGPFEFVKGKTLKHTFVLPPSFTNLPPSTPVNTETPTTETTA